MEAKKSIAKLKKKNRGLKDKVKKGVESEEEVVKAV